MSHILFHAFGHFDKLIFKPSNKRQRTSRPVRTFSRGDFAIAQTAEEGVVGLRYTLLFHRGRLGRCIDVGDGDSGDVNLEAWQGETKGANGKFGLAQDDKKKIITFTVAKKDIVTTFPSMLQAANWKKLPPVARKALAAHPIKNWH